MLMCQITSVLEVHLANAGVVYILSALFYFNFLIHFVFETLMKNQF
jgi:hypothetical protein